MSSGQGNSVGWLGLLTALSACVGILLIIHGETTEQRRLGVCMLAAAACSVVLSILDDQRPPTK